MKKKKTNWNLMKDNPPRKDADYTKIILKDWYGEIKVMAEANDYLMVVRSRCSPFVISKKDALNFKCTQWREVN